MPRGTQPCTTKPPDHPATWCSDHATEVFVTRHCLDDHAERWLGPLVARALRDRPDVPVVVVVVERIGGE
jgi:hypothetical protein